MSTVEIAVVAFEFTGVAVMLVGFAIALLLGGVTLVRQRNGTLAFRRVRSALGGAILLGLEILVAADIVKTVSSQLALEDVLALGLIVLIRTVLSFTIQIEIDGFVPWKRAMFESGATHLSRAVRDTVSAATPDAPGTSGEPAQKQGG